MDESQERNEIGWLSRLMGSVKPPSFEQRIEGLVMEVAAKTIREMLPSTVERIISKRLKESPDAELTKIGFEWAFYLSLRDMWPDVTMGETSRWLWEYIQPTKHGDPDYDWRAQAAAELANSYANEYGEIVNG